MPFPFTPAEFLATLPKTSNDKCQAVRNAFLTEPKFVYDFIAFIMQASGAGVTPAFLNMFFDVGDYKFSLRDDLDDGVTAARPWLICQGGAFVATEFPTLATKIGTKFDAAFTAPPVGSVRLPDFRERFFLPFKSASKTFGAIGGAETVTLSQAQGAFRAHAHVYGDDIGDDDGRFLKGVSTSFTPGGQTYKEVHGDTGSANEGTMSAGSLITAPAGPTAAVEDHNNMPPFLVAGYVYIKT
jgi:microcystin-dependent protein